MTKDVIVSVRGLQFMEADMQDSIETIQQGEYYNRNGSHFLLYDEYMEGFEEPAKNILRFHEHELMLTKRGLLNVQMNFTEGKKSLTHYRTPFGGVMIGLDTSRVEYVLEEHQLTLEVDYILEANELYVADCHIRIIAQEKGYENLHFYERTGREKR